MPAPARSQQVGRWEVEYTDASGSSATQVAEGKLVLKEDWTLVVDPKTSDVLLAVPTENTSKVVPA